MPKLKFKYSIGQTIKTKNDTGKVESIFVSKGKIIYKFSLKSEWWPDIPESGIIDTPSKPFEIDTKFKVGQAVSRIGSKDLKRTIKSIQITGDSNMPIIYWTLLGTKESDTFPEDKLEALK